MEPDHGQRAQSRGADDLLTLTQAAAFLDISKSTMYRLVDHGKVRSSKVGRQWRFRKEDLEAYLDRSPVAVVNAPEDELNAELALFASAARPEEVRFVGDRSPEAHTDPAEGKLRSLAAHIIRRAFFSRASDIHLDPVGRGGDAHLLLRLRVDGVLQEVRKFPAGLAGAVIVSLKALAGMDTLETRLPQNGKIWATVGEKELDLRVTTVPSLFGESLTGRLLDPASIRLSLDDIGLVPADRERFTDWITRPNGIVMVTGPVGSGKTTVLYSCIRQVTRPEVKLLSIEDPIEYALPGVTQIQVNAKIGLTFASCVQTVMRLDPDVVLVGEVGGADTLNGCCRLATTGHLVLTTLHADDALSVLARVADWGTEPFLLAGTLVGISSQRLVRKLCPVCKDTAEVPPSLLAKAYELAEAGGHSLRDDADFLSPVGCEKCFGGYRGRTGIYELLPATSGVKEAFIAGVSRPEMREVAIREGMTAMAADGIRKAAEGVTSLEEVLRVLALPAG